MADFNVGALKGSIQIDYGSVTKATEAVKSLQNQFSNYTSAAKKAETITKSNTAAVKAQTTAVNSSSVSQERLLKAYTQLEHAEKQLLILRRQSAAETAEGTAALNQARASVDNFKKTLQQTGLTSLQLTDAYESMQQQLIRASVATTGLNQATANARTWFRTSRAAAAQLGMQLQDIAVQAQMSTNWLIILGQQGSQILGFFGAFGAAAGAVLAVGSALAYVVSNSKVANDGAKALSKVVDDLSSNFKSASSNALVLSESILKLAEVSEGAARLELKRQYVEAQREINNTGKTLRALLGNQDRFFTAGVMQIKILTDAGMEAGEIYNRLSGNVNNASIGVQTALSAISAAAEEATKKFGLTEEEALSLFSSVAKVQSETNEGSLQGLIDTLDFLEKNASEANDEFTLFAAELASVATAAVQAIRKGEDVKKVLSDLDGALKNIKSDDSIDNLTEQFEKLIASVDPAAKELLEFRSQIKIIQAAVREGIINEKQADALVNKLNEVSEASKKAGEETKTAADRIKEYIENIREEYETLNLSNT